MRMRLQNNIECISQVKAFQLIPFVSEAFHNVQGAEVFEYTGDEGDSIYRIDLLTDQGLVPLTILYSPGASIKYKVAEKINSFVQSKDEATLNVIEPGYLNLENILLWLFGLFICLLPALWDGAKELWQRYNAYQNQGIGSRRYW
jgi:hypothetical protein